MTVRFTILAALAVALCATSASAQASQTPPSAKPPSKDGPWHVLVAIGGLGGLPSGADAEVGLRLGPVYVHGGAAWLTGNGLDPHVVRSAGIDGIFGRRGRGFAGLGVMFTGKKRGSDDEMMAAFGRFGLQTPLSRHLSIRFSVDLGLEAVDEWECDRGTCSVETLEGPLFIAHLALAYRL